MNKIYLLPDFLAAAIRDGGRAHLSFIRKIHENVFILYYIFLVLVVNFSLFVVRFVRQDDSGTQRGFSDI